MSSASRSGYHQNVCHRHATCQPLQYRLHGITQATNAWLAMANVGVARDAVHGRILLWSTTFHTMPPQPVYGRNSRRCATCCPLTCPKPAVDSLTCRTAGSESRWQLDHASALWWAGRWAAQPKKEKSPCKSIIYKGFLAGQKIPNRKPPKFSKGM